MRPVSRATARARQTAEFAALSPVYWALGPILNFVPYLLVPIMFWRPPVLESSNGDISVPLGVLIGLIALSVGALSIRSRVVLAERQLWIRHWHSWRCVQAVRSLFGNLLHRRDAKKIGKTGAQQYDLFTEPRLASSFMPFG